MTRITFIEHNGTTHTVETGESPSLMRVAVDNMVPGITADCGGACSCGTCHAYIESPWSNKIPPPADNEEAMLDGVLHRKDSSRLTCQVKISAELDGLVVKLPESQF